VLIQEIIYRRKKFVIWFVNSLGDLKDSSLSLGKGAVSRYCHLFIKPGLDKNIPDVWRFLPRTDVAAVFVFSGNSVQKPFA